MNGEYEQPGSQQQYEQQLSQPAGQGMNSASLNPRGGVPQMSAAQHQQMQQHHQQQQQQQQHAQQQQQHAQQQQQSMGHPGSGPPGQQAMQLMLVNVPPNVHAGEQMVVMTPTGQQYMVVVPQGAGPNSQFQIAVPRPPEQHMMQYGQGHGMGGYGGHQYQHNPYASMSHMGHYGSGTPAAAAAAAAAASAAGLAAENGRGRGRGRGGRKRKDRDAQRAPRPPSAYNLFMKDEVARLKAASSELTHKEAFKEAARNWGTAEANPQRRGVADQLPGASVKQEDKGAVEDEEDGGDEGGEEEKEAAEETGEEAAQAEEEDGGHAQVKVEVKEESAEPEAKVPRVVPLPPAAEEATEAAEGREEEQQEEAEEEVEEEEGNTPAGDEEEAPVEEEEEAIQEEEEDEVTRGGHWMSPYPILAPTPPFFLLCRQCRLHCSTPVSACPTKYLTHPTSPLCSLCKSPACVARQTLPSLFPFARSAGR
jgi:hypothetical protein